VAVEGLGVPGRLVDVTLRLEGGAVALIGANGAGKSSLLHVLAGRLRPRTGRARLFGRPPRAAEVARLRAYVPQRIELPPHLRVAEVLDAAARARDAGEAALAEARDRMGLEPLLQRPVGRLSGGMRQRVALAAGLVGAPPLWLLDEPASALDAGGLARLEAWAREHVAAGGTVLVSAHRPEEVDAFAREAVLMKDGRVLGRHPGTELFELQVEQDGRPVPVPSDWRVRRRPSALLRDTLEGDDAT
jgi:ABC-type multidrug transport system ATPase subunit